MIIGDDDPRGIDHEARAQRGDGARLGAAAALTGALSLQPFLEEIPERHVDLGIAQGGRQRPAEPPMPTTILDADDQPVPPGHPHQHVRYRQHPSRVHDGDPDPLIGKPPGRRHGERGERADTHQQHVVAVARGGPSQHVDPLDARYRRYLLDHRALGEPQRGRAVVHRDRLGQLFSKTAGVAGCGHLDTRHDAQHRQIPHAVVAGSVITGDAGPVQGDRDRSAQQRNVHQQLVERAVEERGVQRQAGGTRHCRGDRDQVGPLTGQLDQLFGEDAGPGGPRRCDRRTGLRIHHLHLVHQFRSVVLRRRVAVALAGHRVHDHRTPEVLRPAQRGFQGPQVVPVNGTQVLQPEVLEENLRGQGVLQAALGRVQAGVDGPTHHRGALQGLLAGL